MILHSDSSSNRPKQRRNATATQKQNAYIRKVRPSFPQWCEKFDASAAERQVAQTLSEWSLYGLPVGFLKAASWLYYCGPNQENVSHQLVNRLRLDSLPRRMNDLAGDLDEAISQGGPGLVRSLDQINDLLPEQIKIPGNQKLSELAKCQSKLLRLLAVVFESQLHCTERLVAGRKLAATRVLVWLYWGLKTCLQESNNKTYLQMANLLEIANDASGSPAKAPNELQIRQRIARFIKDHHEEFARIEEHWSKHKVPPEPVELFSAMTFGPVFFKAPKI